MIAAQGDPCPDRARNFRLENLKGQSALAWSGSESLCCWAEN
jgi:hypothetical protein